MNKYILLTFDIIAIVLLISTLIYINKEKQLVKDIASGRTNPCYQCMHKTNWTCFSEGQPVIDQYMNQTKYELEVSCANVMSIKTNLSALDGILKSS